MANKSYPHPVLMNNDDFDTRSSFSADLNVRSDDENENWLFSVRCNLKNSTLEKMIENGQAHYIADIESQNSFYRKTVGFKTNITNISIPANEIRDKVTIQIYIVAVRSMENYLPENCHPDYQGSLFSLSPGDVLADAGLVTLPADPLFDPMTATADSFLKIDRSPTNHDYAYVEPGESTICIYLPKKDWENFERLSRQDTAQEILHSSIVLPMLTSLISDIAQTNPNEVKPINAKLKTLLQVRKLTELPAETAAQILLGLPISRSLAALNRIAERS